MHARVVVSDLVSEHGEGCVHPKDGIVLIVQSASGLSISVFDVFRDVEDHFLDSVAEFIPLPIRVGQGSVHGLIEELIFEFLKSFWRSEHAGLEDFWRNVA